ncbi:MAG: DegV family protein, partial [Candidatus Fimadaptatus sp.]
ESTCDLSREYIDAHPCLEVVPMVFQFGAEEHLDIAGQTDNHRNYERLRAGEVATTSQLNSDYLYGQMKKHLQNGDDVLYLAFSSGLSGTCSNGMLAANELRGEFPERKLTVVDTLCPSLMEGMLAIMTAERLERTGEDVDALSAWVETIKPRLNAWFTVDDLKFLKRGGRISAATAAIGTMLSIKPVLHVDDEGHLIAMSKERGRKRALKALVDRMETQQFAQDTPIYIGHGDCLEDAQAVAAMIKERFGREVTLINYIGMVIGAHSGPGTVALFFVGKDRG